MDATYNPNGGYLPTTKRHVDSNNPNFYPTPKWATHALMGNEHFEGDVWECACGDGTMSKVIESYGYKVKSSDLFDRGYGEADVDFLKSENKCSNVITNPPYNSAQSFAEKAFEVAENKAALLLRLAFLESVNRANTIFSDTPPSRVWVFSERITFYPKNAVRAGSGTTVYAWFVWDKSYSGPTILNWLKPGYKKRYQ